MNDVKRFNRRILVHLILILLVVAGLIFAFIAAGLWIENVNIQFVVCLGSLILGVMAYGILQGRMDRLMQFGYLARIRANAGDPLPMDYTRDMGKTEDRLKCLGYRLHRRETDHALYFRVTKDDLRKTFPKHVLEVVVLLEPDVTGFYLNSVDVEIGEIQQSHLKLGKRIDRMLITQIKEITDLDEKTKESIKEIIYVRTRYTILSTINVGLYRPKSLALMLYAATYRPSIYYRKHLEEIRRIL